MGRRALLIVEDGVDDFELYYARYRLLEAGFQVVVASHSKHSNLLVYDDESGSVTRAPRRVKGKYGVEHRVDTTYREALSTRWDIVVVPGGRSPERARLHPEALEIVRRQYEAGGLIVAICHGPLLLASAGVVRGKRITGHPGIADDLRNAGAIYTGAPAERDGNIVTIRHTTTVHEGFRLVFQALGEA